MTGHEKGVPILEMRRDKRVDPEHRMRLDAAIHRQGRGWFTAATAVGHGNCHAPIAWSPASVR